MTNAHLIPATLIGLAAVALLTCSAPADEPPSSEVKLAIAHSERVSEGAPLDSSLSAVSAFELFASSDETRGAIRFGRQRTYDDNGTHRSSAFTATLSAPLDATGMAQPFTLDGLQSDADFELSYRATATDGFGKHPPQNHPICEAAFASYAASNNVDLDTARKEGCSTNLIAKFNPDALDAYQRLSISSDALIHYWGFSGKVGRKDFDFLDPACVSACKIDPLSGGIGVQFWL